MTNRDLTLTAAAVAAGALIVLAGCEGEEPVAVKNVAPVKTAPPPPPPPTVKSVDSLIAELGIDPMVMMLEDAAPSSTVERKAVLEFFDAFARADASAARLMMSPLDQTQLDVIVEEGSWSEVKDDLYGIMIESGTSPDGDRCVLALFDVDGDAIPQPQLWYYTDEGDGSFIFEAGACPPGIMNELHGTDQITIWHEILDKEMELASLPEDDLSIEPIDLDESGGSSSGGSTPGFSPNPGGPSPGGPGMPGRRPTPPPRRPPGPGGDV